MPQNLLFLLLNTYNYSTNKIILTKNEPLNKVVNNINEEEKLQLEFIKEYEYKYLKNLSIFVAIMIISNLILNPIINKTSDHMYMSIFIYILLLLISYIWKYVFKQPIFSLDFSGKFIFKSIIFILIKAFIYYVVPIFILIFFIKGLYVEDSYSQENHFLFTITILVVIIDFLICSLSPWKLSPLYERQFNTFYKKNRNIYKEKEGLVY